MLSFDDRYRYWLLNSIILRQFKHQAETVMLFTVMCRLVILGSSIVFIILYCGTDVLNATVRLGKRGLWMKSFKTLTIHVSVLTFSPNNSCTARTPLELSSHRPPWVVSFSNSACDMAEWVVTRFLPTYCVKLCIYAVFLSISRDLEKHANQRR